ncbi:putative GTPase regulator [Neospora caninum Liverpool]|nr:putative GTPase regulator [Neospora caninum Liverpool]CBZ55830.1 putative GTPase regulator [Neospora caninum Liverpool]|eukprot:XP_003885856.1 putative GTPase regulator [Neospora caninum Liverpool]
MAEERERQVRQSERVLAAVTAAEREEQREQERRRQEKRRRLFSGEAPLTLEALKKDKELGYVLDELIQRKRVEKQRHGTLTLPFKNRFPLRLLRVGTELYGRVKKILPFGCRLDVGCIDTSALLHVRDMAEITAAKSAGAAFAREARDGAESDEIDCGSRRDRHPLENAPRPGRRSPFVAQDEKRRNMSAAGFAQDDQEHLAQHWIQYPGTVLRQGQLVRVYVKHVDRSKNVLAVSTRPPYSSSFAFSSSSSSSPYSSSSSSSFSAPTVSLASEYRGDLTGEEIREREEARRAQGRGSFADFFVGQEVEGRVTRVTYMGLFVDVNGEEDAFIHFYELHRHRMQRLSNADRQRLEAARKQFDPVALEVLRSAEKVVTEEVEEAEKRRQREGAEAGYSRLAALREMFAEKDDRPDADEEAKKKSAERREREMREKKWIYNVGEWVTDLRVASIDARRKRMQLSRRPASELLSRWREKLREEQREVLTPQQREGLRKQEEAEEENEAMKALRRQREEELALKVYRQYKKKMAAMAREREGKKDLSLDGRLSSEEGEAPQDGRDAREKEEKEAAHADPIARKKAEQMRRFKSFGIDIFEAKRDEEEIREAMEYLQRWRTAYAHRRMQEAAYKEKKRLQRLQRKAPDEMSIQDAWRLASTIDEEIGLKDLVADARKHAQMSGVRTLQLPDFSGRYPKMKEVEPEELDQFYPGVLSESSDEAAKDRVNEEAEENQEEDGGGGPAWTAEREESRGEGNEETNRVDNEQRGREGAQETGDVKAEETAGDEQKEKDERLPEEMRGGDQHRQFGSEGERRERLAGLERDWRMESRRHETERRTEDKEQGDFFGRALEKMRLRTELKLKEEATRGQQQRQERLWMPHTPSEEVEEGTVADANCMQASQEERGERGGIEQRGEKAETREKKETGTGYSEGSDHRGEAEPPKTEAEEGDANAGEKKGEMPVPPAPDEFVNVGKNPALRVLRDLALATSRQAPASKKKERDFTDEERAAVLKDLRMHAIEGFKQMQKQPARKTKGGKDKRKKQEAWANQVFLEAEEEEDDWRDKVKAGKPAAPMELRGRHSADETKSYRDETDEAFDEVLSALGIEDLTEEVLEEARKRQMLRKLQADRSDLAGDVKKILRSLVAQRDRQEVRAFEEAAGEATTSESDWEAKATAAQRLLFQGSEASWRKEIEDEFGEPDVLDKSDKKIQETLLREAERAEKKMRKQERKGRRSVGQLNKTAQAGARQETGTDSSDDVENTRDTQERAETPEGESDEEEALRDFLSSVDEEGFADASCGEGEAGEAQTEARRRAESDCWWEYGSVVDETPDEAERQDARDAGDAGDGEGRQVAGCDAQGEEQTDRDRGEDVALSQEFGGDAAAKEWKRQRRRMEESDFDENAFLSEIEQDLQDVLAQAGGEEEDEEADEADWTAEENYRDSEDTGKGKPGGCLQQTGRRLAVEATEDEEFSIPSWLSSSSPGASCPDSSSAEASSSRAHRLRFSLSPEDADGGMRDAEREGESPVEKGASGGERGDSEDEAPPRRAHAPSDDVWNATGCDGLAASEPPIGRLSSFVAGSSSSSLSLSASRGALAPHQLSPSSPASASPFSLGLSSLSAASEERRSVSGESGRFPPDPPSPVCRLEVEHRRAESLETPGAAKAGKQGGAGSPEAHTNAELVWQTRLSSRARLLPSLDPLSPALSSALSCPPVPLSPASRNAPASPSEAPSPLSEIPHLSASPALVSVDPSSASVSSSLLSREEQLVRRAVLSMAEEHRREKEKRDRTKRRRGTAAEAPVDEDGGDVRENAKRPMNALLEEERERKRKEQETSDFHRRHAAKLAAAYALRLPQRPVRTLEDLKRLHRAQRREAEAKEQEARAREKLEAKKEERKQRRARAAKRREQEGDGDTEELFTEKKPRSESPHRILLEAARRSHERGVFGHMLGTLHSDDTQAKKREARVLRHAGEDAGAPDRDKE